MGTRCITIFKDEDDKVLCSVWNKYDGHPRDFGEKVLIEFLASRTLAKSWQPQDRTVFGGIGDAAAAFISYLKCYGHPYYTTGPIQGLPDMKEPKQWREPEIGHVALLPVTLNLSDIRCEYVYVVRPSPPTATVNEEPYYGFVIETYLHPNKLLFTATPLNYEWALDDYEMESGYRT